MGNTNRLLLSMLITCHVNIKSFMKGASGSTNPNKPFYMPWLPTRLIIFLGIPVSLLQAVGIPLAFLYRAYLHSLPWSDQLGFFCALCVPCSITFWFALGLLCHVLSAFTTFVWLPLPNFSTSGQTVLLQLLLHLPSGKAACHRVALRYFTSLTLT